MCETQEGMLKEFIIPLYQAFFVSVLANYVGIYLAECSSRLDFFPGVITFIPFDIMKVRGKWD